MRGSRPRRWQVHGWRSRWTSRWSRRRCLPRATCRRTTPQCGREARALKRPSSRATLTSSFHQLPRAARAYVLAVAAAGGAILAWRVAAHSFPYDAAFLILTLLAAALGSRTVSLGQKAEMALSLPLI